MNKLLEHRVLKEAEIIIETRKTLRELEKYVDVSKSTIHKDMQERLKQLDYDKYCIVREVFQNHIQQRHINGGISTKRKYKQKSKEYKRG